MSLINLATYHLSPWVFATLTAAPFVWRGWRRLPRERMTDDIAGQVHDGSYFRMRRGLGGGGRG